MSEYELKTQKFSGPLEKLLELVEERKLQIGEISLAEVTGDFLKYVAFLKQSGEISHRALADFVVIASRLILIKSKSLLPELTLTSEEEGEIADLTRRLNFYRAFRPLMKIIATEWKNETISYSRPYFLDAKMLHPGVFYPGTNLTQEGVRSSLAHILEGLERFVHETGTIKETIINLEEKIQEVMRRIGEAGTMAFSRMTHEGSRGEIIAIFLAVLHLAREQLILLEQESAFSDIMITHPPSLPHD